ncbi:alpha/beta hydrolase domain-containing protein [Pseudomonas sp. M47T1]|uniref:alpha/beta hydrolase n=1 Tax=unclassified Pseudomonas TaxID=196821 RepID=UPI0002606B84|nr:alpha/beta hydrolase [Pseudomonas sp. M47T1]EIK96378.1 alpha/beta hydrolase domain-containing protein [Pseudomonas sp. M47T1]
MIKPLVLLLPLVLAACASSPPALTPEQLAQAEAANLRPDADMGLVLDKLASLNPQPIENLDVDTARLQPTLADAAKAVLADQGRDTDPATWVPGVTAYDRTVPGAAGQIPATVYTPEGGTYKPVILYFHGGGWVLADRKAYDSSARSLAKLTDAVVVSIDYRRAPEDRFPAAVDDGVAVYRWLTHYARAVGGDPQHLGLAGESAGGNLALATAIAAHEQGLAAPKHVLAIYPVTQTGSDTESYSKYAHAKPLNAAMMPWFLNQLLSDPSQKQDPRLDVLHANLQGLPPVTLINAEIDPLRDDGALMETALKAAGVNVERRVYSGVTHEFFGLGPLVEKSAQAQAYAGERMTADLHRGVSNTP